MGDFYSIQPRWLKASQASAYSALSKRRLVQLCQDGEIVGYQDTGDQRGPKGRGVWVFDRNSIDAYHLRQSGQDRVKLAVARLVARTG